LAGQERGVEFQPPGILKYVEDLKRSSNAEFGPKDYLEIASKKKAAGFKPTALKKKTMGFIFCLPMVFNKLVFSTLPAHG
jgi:hypothetical protein